MAGFQDIEVGDRVTILVHAGGVGRHAEWREATGTAKIISPPHWEGPIQTVALDMGGRYGRPGVATPENFVRVSKRRRNPNGRFRYRQLPPATGAQLATGGMMVRPNPPQPKLFQRLKLTPRSKWVKGVADADEAIAMFRENAKQLGQESFWVVPMDNKNAPLGFVEVTRGLVDASLVHPRETFAPAFITGAAQIMVFHNHPSGDPEPSPQDDEITRRLKDAGSILGIDLLDHVVVGAKGHFSYAEKGRL